MMVKELKAGELEIEILGMCACVRACAPVRACVCVCVCVLGGGGNYLCIITQRGM